MQAQCRNHRVLTGFRTRCLQHTVLLDPYAKAIVGRREFGRLGPVGARHVHGSYQDLKA